jgi:hypothetical protein
MNIREVIDHLEGITVELKLAQHVRGRLTELREIHESDKETFDRVIDEALDLKYPLAKPRRPK